MDESIDIAESGYPEEQPAGTAHDAEAGGVAPQENAAADDEAAANAPDNDEGRTATGNPNTDRRPG